MTPSGAHALHCHVEVIFDIVYLLTGCFCIHRVLSFVNQAPSCLWSLKPVWCRNPNSLTLHSFQLLLSLHLCSWKGMSFYRKRGCPRETWNFMFELVIFLHSWFYSLLCLFFPLGTCWPSLWGSESLEFVLGGWRFHLQVFWSDPDWSIP